MPTKQDTSSLSGWDLNQAVAIAAGMKWRVISATEATAPGILWLQTWRSYPHGGYWGLFNPAGNWSEAGPLIEAERIQVEPDHECGLGGQWFARAKPAHYDGHARRVSSWKVTRSGPTALVAAMRAYVALRLGDTVELS